MGDFGIELPCPATNADFESPLATESIIDARLGFEQGAPIRPKHVARGPEPRLGRFRQHTYCQSVIVLLNLALIVLMMIPSFRVHVSPRIPLRLGKAYYALATAHAALGSVTEVAGLYILLAAGTSVLPHKFRITKYKAWMRTVLVLWWLVLLLGLATYARWYVPHLFRK